MYEYAHLNTDVEPGNQDYQLLLSHILTLFDQFENNLDFMNVEIIKNKEAIEKYLKEITPEEENNLKTKYPEYDEIIKIIDSLLIMLLLAILL